MFYFFAVTSMVAYALQNILIAHFARKMDGLSLALYRNGSFAITLLPLLIGSSRQDISNVLQQWPLLILSSVAGGVFLAIFYTAYRFLTAGVLSALSRAVTTIALTLAGFIFLHEQVSPLALFIIGFILAGTVSLSLYRTDFAHLDERFWLGVGLALFSGIPLATAYYVLVILSRTASPLVSGYFWEVFIGAACIILIAARWFLYRKPLELVPSRQFFIIASASTPTLVGTGLYSLAATMGPVAILNTIASAGLVVTALLGWLFYHERLRPMQWVSIAIVAFGVMTLQFV